MKLFISTLIFTLLAIDFVVQTQAEEAPIVETKYGKVRGYRKQTVFENKAVFVYEGIRYGKAPVGDRRFRKPEPAEPWKEIYNATNYRHTCWHSFEIEPDNQIPEWKDVSEDCLFLSIYRPEKSTCGKKLPVMVFIHGGAYETGSIFSLVYDGSYIATVGEVIMVTVNYRLGAFGFLYADTDDVQGNAGIYDQLLALKWVNDNIEQFGGDPNKITLFGESAGSMSTGILVLSPLAKGLFQRAIMQSGSPNGFVASENRDNARVKTLKMAESLDCASDDMNEVIKCLRKLPAKDLSDVTKTYRIGVQYFMPVYGEAIFPEEPVKALKAGKFNDVDLIFGHVKDEGTIFTETIFPNYLSPFIENPKFTKKQATTIISLMFMVFKETFGKEVAEFYTKNIADTDVDGLRMSVAKAFGDYNLQCPTVFFGQTVAMKNSNKNVYSYLFSKSPERFHTWKECIGYMGVCHGDDVNILFGFPIKLRGVVFSEEEYQLSLDMIRAWAKFADTGKPGNIGNVEWRPALDHSKPNPTVSFMNLNSVDYKMVDDYYVPVCDNFWREKIF